MMADGFGCMTPFEMNILYLQIYLQIKILIKNKKNRILYIINQQRELQTPKIINSCMHAAAGCWLFK